MLNETSAPPCAQYDKLARDLETMGALGGVPILLHALCESSGMGFAAIGCVTGDGWMAGAVEDRIGLGLRRGDPFKVDFADSGGQGHSAVFAALRAPTHRYVLTIGGEHHVPIARYLWVAIILTGGRYVGNLCVIDPRPDETLQPWITPLLQRFSQLIAQEFDAAQNRVREHVALLDERAAGELREQFIAILGHDLRNPLQAVSAIGELLERRLDDPALAQMASRIRTNARRMFALIDDVLDFARGRLGGGIDVQLRDVDNIGGALLAVVQELQDAQPDRKIIANVDVRCPVRCDVGRLQQVVSNLLANALTHGAAGTPVRFTAAADHACLTLEVWNDGEPIPANSMSKIFSPFWRHTVSKDREGLGLGLHICAQIVRAHGGQITVHSDHGSGTRFTARVPLGTHDAGVKRDIRSASAGFSRS